MIGLDDPSLAAAFEAKTLRHEPWPPAAPFVIATNTWQGAQVRTGLLQVIGAAGKRLVIQHAYFSANIILVAIKAALARGVAVDLILPRAPATHGPANRMAINQLLASPHADRLRVFHFPRMSHAKTIVADGAIVAIGSANLTPRSLYVSGETVMFAHFPAEHPFIGKLTARLERDIEECERITVPFPMGAREKARAMVGKYIW
jgi:phosphatidylserine/phosphatidylglycerophosphate/cardiolipin synthase-like enzyme